MEVIIIKSKNKAYQYSTPLNEIKYLRGMQDFLIDSRNSNRYRIMVKESLGHTAYCFSTPIYNIHTRKLVRMVFEKSKNGYLFKGSTGSMSIHRNRCVFQTNEGRAIISLNEAPEVQNQHLHSQAKIIVSPTLNGMRFIVRGNQLKLQLRSETNQEVVRFHSTCFSIMSEKFKPFLSIAALYAYEEKGSLSPLEIRYQNKGSQNYEISLSHDFKNGGFIFEVNLYESKLFQDTTVESLHPDINNAYGAIGFIGKTKQFGEQWLYLRPDFSKIPDLTSDKIEKVLLHIPILNECSESLDVYMPQKRFCSFGSTWNKKVNASEKVASSNNAGRYITIDVTSIFTNRTEQTLVYNEGLILKKPKGNNNFIAISTGDCYSAPQILEIKFKQ